MLGPEQLPGRSVSNPDPVQTLIERWDGRTWTVQKSPDAGGPSTSSHLNGVAVTSVTKASVALLFMIARSWECALMPPCVRFDRAIWSPCTSVRPGSLAGSAE